MDARTIQLPAILRVQTITLGEKESQRLRLGRREIIPNGPHAVEFCGRASFLASACIVNRFVLLLKGDSGCLIWQVKEPARDLHSHKAIRV